MSLDRGGMAASKTSQAFEPAIPQVNILGVGVSAINMAMALRIIDDWIAAVLPPISASPAYTALWRVDGIQACGEFITVRDRSHLTACRWCG